jgi:hypothetical protein
MKGGCEMKRTIVMLFVLLPAVAWAQSANQKAVFALEEGWTVGLVKNDTAMFRRITAPGFVYTEDNSVMTQAQLIKAMVSGSDVVTKSWNEGMKFYDYAPAAVVTGILHVQGTSNKKPFHRRYRFTDTWFYKNGKWQLIAAQDYLIPK